MPNTKDLYMNFTDVTTTLDATDSSTLESTKVDTGLSVRGNLCWLIHLIEVYFAKEQTGAGIVQKMAISTVDGLTTFPGLGDKGLILSANQNWEVVTSGGGLIVMPKQFSYLPPIPLAAPQLVLYCETDADHAGLRGADIEARIGFTTTPMTNAMYTEIAETWGY